MGVDVDSSKVLYVVGAVFGFAAILYFGAEVIVEMSPTLKSTLLLLAFAFFLVAAQYTETESVDTVAYVLAAGSYVVFLWYTVTRFDLGETGVFLLLAVSSVMFIGLGYLLRETELELDGRQARVIAAALALLMVAAVAGDVVGAQPSAETEWMDGFTVDDDLGFGDSVKVGETTLSNEFLLSRFADVPRYTGCVYPGGETASLSHVEDDTPVSGQVLLSGGSERRFDVEVSMRGFADEDREGVDDVYLEADEIPVEVREDCPAESDDVKLVVVGAGGSSPPLPPR